MVQVSQGALVQARMQLQQQQQQQQQGMLNQSGLPPVSSMGLSSGPTTQAPFSGGMGLTSTQPTLIKATTASMTSMGVGVGGSGGGGGGVGLRRDPFGLLTPSEAPLTRM